MDEIVVERRSTILPPPLHSEVAELDLELLAAYARTDAPELDGVVDAFQATTASSDTDLAPLSDALPTTLVPPAPPAAIGLGLWYLTA